MKTPFILALFFIGTIPFAQNHCPILPNPVTYTSTKDSIALDSLLFCTKSLSSTLSNSISPLGDLYLLNKNKPLRIGREDGFIRFEELNNAYPESYSINVTKSKIILSYTSPASCYHALHSLFQLITEKPDHSFSIPICFVKDFPNFSWRGLHLDVARHFFSIHEVKKYLDLMAMYKFNVFHWHLTDDQGWRIEIKKYPKLTSVGAWRDSTVNDHFSTYPRTWDTKRYGGFYTQEEIKEVVRYAADRHITIVPEIEMPGHARAALAAYPAFSCTGKQQPVPGLWGVFEDVFCTKDSTLHFLEDVLEEVLSLFPGKFIHIGGDEVPKSRWEKCASCQNKMHALHLKNEHELQSYFIRQIDAYLAKNNRQLIGWDEILEGGLSPGAAVMSWRGMDGGIAAAKEGHYVVMTPGSHCYFDHYQGKSSSEPLAIGGYTPLEKVFEFNPIPKSLTPQEAHFVLGAQANLWTEYIPNFNQLTYMTYPRAIALSQVLWGGTKTSYDAFEQTLKKYHIPRLTGPNVHTKVSMSFLKPSMKFSREPKGLSLMFYGKDTSEKITVVSQQKKEGFSISYGKKLFFNRSQKNVKHEKFTFSTACCTDSLTIISHCGLGAKVTYVTPPNERYHPGDLTLVDGQFGARPWRGYQWVGFDTNHINITLELDRKIRLNGITFGFLNEPSSWIHLPNEITVRLDNGKLKTISVTEERTKLPIKGKTKSIHVSMKGLPTIPVGFPGQGEKPWIFCDELVFE